ncbi:WapI family immunity protein [Gynuella sp.]|uniref:WapI family immunity protein n=1 Tax=Gynuella sp. TaxID=2969146 RepID=UPI003D15036A
MFRLKNVEGKIDFSLEVIGYQFPERKEDDWCLLKVKIDQGEDRCELVDPALETTELVQLLRWFSSLAEGQLPRYSCLTFIEPCLKFNFLAFNDGAVRIAINLSHELKPPFKMEQFIAKSEDWNIVIELHANDFANIDGGIKMALEKYPVRGS